MYETDHKADMEATLGKDMTRFLLRSRKMGEMGVVHSIESAPASTAQVRRILDLLNLED